MGTLDLGVEQVLQKVVLSFATTISGGLSVMMSGQLKMLWWCADNSDIQHQVYIFVTSN